MNAYRNKKYRGQVLCMSIVIAIVLALAVLNLMPEKGIEPDITYPMANQHIEWRWAGRE